MNQDVPQLSDGLLKRPVAVFGDGESGRGACSVLARIGVEGVVYDARGAEFTRAAAARHSLAVFSPGFAPDHPWIRLARESGATALGEIDFASLFWKGRILAVTGTNGKTTLVEFLAHALGGIGLDARAAGNIGRSLSRLASDGGCTAATIAVCEISSFQAETMGFFAAEALLWTNFAEDHLERHPGMEAYFRAKAAVAERSGTVFAGSSVRAWVEANGGVSAAFPHPPGRPGWGPNWIDTAGQAPDPRLSGTVFADHPQRENFLLAAAWWRAAGYDAGDLFRAARTFEVGRHRLSRVAEIGGVVFWNDSKATNFHAVEAALGRFGSPVLLIAGGKSKGGDIAGFAGRIAPRVKRAFLIGETGAELAAAFASAGVPHSMSGTLAAAVRGALSSASPGDNVLLSPGFASFDQFKGYADRGDRFEALVRGANAAHPAFLAG